MNGRWRVRRPCNLVNAAGERSALEVVGQAWKQHAYPPVNFAILLSGLGGKSHPNGVSGLDGPESRMQRNAEFLLLSRLQIHIARLGREWANKCSAAVAPSVVGIEGTLAA